MPNTLQTHSPETTENVEQSAIDTALRNAAESVADIEFSPDFQAYLSDTNQKLNPADAREYWGTVANFTETYLEAHADLSTLEKTAFTLAAALPLVLTASYSLKEYGGRYYPEKKIDKATTCTYNALLKEFVRAYPQQSESLHKSLLEITVLTIGDESKDFLTFADTQTEVTLKGIRHEVGYSQFLETAGIPYREASVEEDLKGRDIVIQHPLKEIGVDVKASLSEVEAHSTSSDQAAYAVKGNGDIIMYSMIKESAFQGGFEPSKQYLSRYSEGFGKTIRDAIVASIDKK